MKIVCTQENFKQGLLTVGRIISSSNTLPILNNLLIKTENGLLKICSTNLEIAIITHIRCKVENEGEVTVVCKTLTDLVNTLPNKNISLEAVEGQLNIEAENYHTSIKTLPAEEFPLIPTIDNQHTLTIEATDLKTAIDQVIFAVSLNQTQPEISGVLLKLEDRSLKTVATDRYRLAEKLFTLKQEHKGQQEIIIPHKTAIETSRIIGAQSGEVVIATSQTQISFAFKETQIISRVIDGQYPDYKQIIPANFSTTVVTERLPLANALRAGGIFSQSSNSVKVDYSSEKQMLVLASESGDLGKSLVELPSNVKGRSGTIIVNYHYVLDCLANIDTENVVLKIVDDTSPSLIEPEGKSDYIYLVMPIKN